MLQVARRKAKRLKEVNAEASTRNAEAATRKKEVETRNAEAATTPTVAATRKKKVKRKVRKPQCEMWKPKREVRKPKHEIGKPKWKIGNFDWKRTAVPLLRFCERDCRPLPINAFPIKLTRLMKRALPVVFSALAGAISLPISMWACAAMAHLAFPSFVAPLPISSTHFLDIRRIVYSGAVLGAWSAILWCGNRPLWARVASTICAAGVGLVFARMLKQRYPTSLMASPDLFWAFAAHYSPVFLWSLGLFFFATLARRKSRGEVLR